MRPRRRAGGSKRVGAALGGGWLKVTAEVATVLALFVAVAAFLQDRANVPGPAPAVQDPPPAAARTTGQEPPTTATPNSDDFVLYDDFSAPTLDPTRWTGIAAAEPFVSVADGALRLQVEPNERGEVSAELQASLPRAAEALRFRMTVRRIAGENDGGASAYLIGSGGRFHEIWGGPNGAGAPAIGYAICRSENPCEAYDSFEQRSELVANVDRPVTVVIRSVGGVWQVEVDGRAWTEVAVEQGPIEGLKFSIYSFGAGFSVDVDDIYVDYTA